MDEKKPPITLESLDEKLNKFIEETRASFAQKTADDNNDFEFGKNVNLKVASLTAQVENLREDFKRETAAMHHDIDEVIKTIKPKKIIVQQLLHFSPNLWFRNIINNLLQKFRRKQ